MDTLPELITCPRLHLRRWTTRDVPRLRDAVHASLEHLRPWMPWIVHEPMTDDDRRALVARWEDEWRAGGDSVLGVVLGDTVVGGCGLHRRRGPTTLEIGYWVHVDHVGHGYARELTAALTSAALAVRGIDRVEIHHDAANVASRRVPESLGFRLDGEVERAPQAPGEIGVEVVWSTAHDDWRPPSASPERGAWIEVRRVDDDELCGHVAQRGGRWVALTVFGGVLGDHEDRDGAERHVLGEGLAALADRWTLRDGTTGEEEVVCIQEANASSVRVARDYYSLPGVPTLTITAAQLAAGEWALVRR